MSGLKLWMSVAVVGLFATQAQAQGYIVTGGVPAYPVVAGPVYTPVPVGVRYTTGYRYVTPVGYTSVPAVAPVVYPSAPVVTTSYYPPTTYVAPTPIYAVPRRVRVNPWRGTVRVRY